MSCARSERTGPRLTPREAEEPRAGGSTAIGSSERPGARRPYLMMSVTGWLQSPSPAKVTGL
jgi:hypothetical protein